MKVFENKSGLLRVSCQKKKKLSKIKETGRRLLQGKSRGTVPWMLSQRSTTGKPGETLAETLNTSYLLQKHPGPTVVTNLNSIHSKHCPEKNNLNYSSFTLLHANCTKGNNTGWKSSEPLILLHNSGNKIQEGNAKSWRGLRRRQSVSPARASLAPVYLGQRYCTHWEWQTD